MQEETVTPQKTRGRFVWSTRDLLLVAIVGIVFGVLLVGLSYLYYLLAFLGPVFQWFYNAPWFLPGFFVAYIVRRPGAAFLASFIFGLVLIPFTPAGVANLVSGVIFGALTELGVAIFTRYHSFRVINAALAGLLTGLIYVLALGAPFGVFNLSVPLIVGVILATMLAGVVAVLIAIALANALARTGTLSSTAFLQERGEEI
jgi:energy-coupling factor transport system permease protein